MKNAICLLLWTLMPGFAVEAADPALIDFEIEDQFERKHSDDDWRGDILLLIGSDQHGSQFDSVWTQAVHDSITGLADASSFRIVHVADVRGVPFFLKGTVRRKFPKETENSIILDWKGNFATAYGFEGDKANILVFDKSATLQHQLAVTEIDSEKLRELTDVISALLGRARNKEHSELISSDSD